MYEYTISRRIHNSNSYLMREAVGKMRETLFSIHLCLLNL